jgi:Glycosyl transferase family 2
MIIHLHTRSWNDRPLLRPFFTHYAPLISHFFIADDGSDDGTLDDLARRADVTVLPVTRADPTSFVMSSVITLNTMWKRSRGVADWVILTDMDEFAWHPDLRGYLAQALADGVTAIPALGYQMLADHHPGDARPLTEVVRRGAPWKQMSKLVAFRPDAITETNHSPGRHWSTPEGHVVYPATDELLNLHYKYLGIDYIMERHARAEPRRLQGDREKGWGRKYAFSRAEIEAHFAEFDARAVEDVMAPGMAALHDEPRWWRRPVRPRPGQAA